MWALSLRQFDGSKMKALSFVKTETPLQSTRSWNPIKLTFSHANQVPKSKQRSVENAGFYQVSVVSYHSLPVSETTSLLSPAFHQVVPSEMRQEVHFSVGSRRHLLTHSSPNHRAHDKSEVSSRRRLASQRKTAGIPCSGLFIISSVW